MSDLLLRKSAPEPVSAIEELSSVRLCMDVDVPAEGVLPNGSVGTVVSVYGDDTAYFVEFEQPFHALSTLDADQILAIPGASRADIRAASALVRTVCEVKTGESAARLVTAYPL